MHDDLRPAFGQVLRGYRQAARLSQDELGIRANLSTRAISDLERGVNRSPRRATLALLADALGLSPQDRLRIEAAADATQPYSTGHLPTPLTSFIGRETEIPSALDLLKRPGVRLVSFVGPAGSGKTRLALQVAKQLESDFPDRCRFVDLSAVTDPARVLPAIATALGVVEKRGLPLLDAIRYSLRTELLLLVLDNFEQVGAAASDIDALLQAAPQLTVLATSRVPLGIYGERLFAVSPLALPDLHGLLPLNQLTQYEAVRLFIERAEEALPGFTVTSENARAVAEICVRLDGLPLALELAAARIPLFPPSALLARLAVRLALLTGGAPTRPTRQQTLREAIAWSYNLLEPGEQRLFRRIAIFRGGRTPEALEAVCNPDGVPAMDMLSGAEALVRKTLVQQRADGVGGLRFWMLETIQEYAEEQLAASGEAEAVGHAHATYFLALAEQAEPRLRASGQAEWMDQLEREHDNFRAAFRWGMQNGEAELSLRLAGAIMIFFETRGHISEWREHLEGALSAPQAEARTPGRAKALLVAGRFAWFHREYPQAHAFATESLAIWRELSDPVGTIAALEGLGLIVAQRSNPDTMELARSLLEESLATRKQIEYTSGMCEPVSFLLYLALWKHDYAWAGALVGEYTTLLRSLDDERGLALFLYGAAILALRQGELQRAVAIFRESLDLATELGDTQGCAWNIAGLGEVAAFTGDPRRAARLFGVANSLLGSIGRQIENHALDSQTFRGTVAAVRAKLGDEVFMSDMAAGGAMSLEQGIAEALGEQEEKP